MPVSKWVEAAELFRQSRFLEAAKCYKEGLESHAYHPAANSARFDLAYCYYRSDDYEMALRALSRLIQKRATIKEAYLLFSRIKSSLGFVISARRAVSLCHQLFPDDVQVLSCLTHVSIYSNSSDEELIALRKKLNEAKQKLSIDDGLGLHLDTAIAHLEIRFGDLRKGERLLARVLATGTAPYEAVLLRGERLLEQGRIIPAREQLTRAMSASPRDHRPISLLARSYLRSGKDLNPNFALQLSQAACKVSKWQNSECLSVLVRAYEAAGEEGYAALFLERIKDLPSTKELDVSYYHGSLQQLRVQKLSNS
jgi:tetratricopeptide (TPR) repeat protein